MSKQAIIIIGNLSRDPEETTLWVKTKSKDKETEHKLVVKGKIAEACSKFAKKGTRIYAEGCITKKHIVVEQLQFLGGTPC